MLVLTYGFRYFWEGTSEKGCIEIEDWGFPVHFVLGLTDSWFQKSYEEFEQLQTSIAKSKKLKHDEILSKKYIPSAKTLHTEDLSNISATCVKIHQIAYVIFETISYFSQHNSSASF